MRERPGRYAVRISPTAERDLEEIADEIAKDSPVEAVRFIGRIRAKMLSLDRLPMRGVPAPEGVVNGFIIRQVNVKHYRILYVIDRKIVMIVGVRHSRRLPLKS